MTPEQPEPAGDPDGLQSPAYRRPLVNLVIAAVLLSPAFHLLFQPVTGVTVFLIAASVTLTILVLWLVGLSDPSGARAPLLLLAVILVLAISVFAAGGQPWLGTLAVAAAVCGRFSRTPRLAISGAVICALAGLATAMAKGYPATDYFAVTVISLLAGLFAYSASRRADAVNMLRRTRAELARAAVAEERLRIARDLHDLLGHSLSLITLKAELAGRIMTTDPDRAGREVAELEQVARQSLSDVRAAVAGYRQPDLAAELTAARQLLDAAGITSRITASGVPGLEPETDAALAWAVREGATNVVRHSRATRVEITVTAGAAVAVAEISDNGPPAGADDGLGGTAVTSCPPVPVRAGSGLAGLAERIRDLGGELAAGAVPPHGFRLRVAVPIGPGRAMMGA